MQFFRTKNSARQHQYATIFGICGVFLWALGPLFNTELTNLPTFEILSVVFTVSFSLSIIKLTMSKQWHRIKQPLIIWLIGIAGIFGNDFFYIQAFKSAPAAHVDLINHLWPILVVLFAGFLPEEKFSFSKIMAVLFGFAGSYLLITDASNATNDLIASWHGYAFAFLAGLTWACYTLLFRFYARIPIEMVGMYFGASLLLALISHHHYEATVTPSVKQLILLVSMGVTTHGLAYWLWDNGIKKGNFQQLSIISYANPIIAVLLLFAFGKTTISWHLAAAAILVVAAAVLSSSELSWQTLQLKSWYRRAKTSTVDAYLKNPNFYS